MSRGAVGPSEKVAGQEPAICVDDVKVSNHAFHTVGPTNHVVDELLTFTIMLCYFIHEQSAVSRYILFD